GDPPFPGRARQPDRRCVRTRSSFGEVVRYLPALVDAVGSSQRIRPRRDAPIDLEPSRRLLDRATPLAGRDEPLVYEAHGTQTSGHRSGTSGCIDCDLGRELRAVGKAADDVPLPARGRDHTSPNPMRAGFGGATVYEGIEARAIDEETAAARMPQEVVDLDPSGWQKTADTRTRTGERPVFQEMRDPHGLEQPYTRWRHELEPAHTTWRRIDDPGWQAPACE